MKRFSAGSQSSDRERGEALGRFREQLDFFVFFHLGADAEVSLEPGGDALRIGIEHSRIRPLALELSWTRVAELAGSPERFESCMLEQLTRHRRHRV